MTIALSFTACGALPPARCGPPGTAGAAFTITGIAWPQEKSQFAVDLNGDNKLDNQWGNIIGALTAQNLDPQTDTDALFKSGTFVLHVQTLSTGAAVDPCAEVLLLSPETTVAGVRGQLSAGTLVSTEPGGGDVLLPVLGDLLKMPLAGVRVSFTAANGELKGQLNGGMPQCAARAVLIPAFTRLLARISAANHAVSSLSQLDGGPAVGPLPCGERCINADGSTPVAHDGRIDECEVASNWLVSGVLSPDVQLFADDGKTYAPNPANQHKDSIAIGFGFTAVPAAN